MAPRIWDNISSVTFGRVSIFTFLPLIIAQHSLGVQLFLHPLRRKISLFGKAVLTFRSRGYVTGVGMMALGMACLAASNASDSEKLQWAGGFTSGAARRVLNKHKK
jgi:hypothetical protein